MNVAIYARVSTDEQNTDNQIMNLVNYCQSLGYEYQVYVESESTRKERPVKEKLLSELMQRKYSAVVVWKLDRWARSVNELSSDVQALQGRGINFISVSDNFDLKSPAGKLQFNIIASFAEFERDLISERTKLGMARAKRDGKRLGRPPKKKG